VVRCGPVPLDNWTTRFVGEIIRNCWSLMFEKTTENSL
jgi:hypothetical protein